MTEVNCQTVFERLSAYLDDELQPADAMAVRDHLQSCANCARRHRLLTQTSAAFRGMALAPADPRLDDAVLRRLRQSRRLRWSLSAAAAVAAALGFLAIRTAMQAPSTNPLTPAALVSLTSDLSKIAVQPGWSDGRVEAAADCGLPGPTVCQVEIPCAAGECSAIGAIKRTLPRPEGGVQAVF